MSKIEEMLKSKLQHYNHTKYWNYREKFVNNKCNK